MIEVKTQEDLQNLISNQIEESLQLEYKSGEALGKSDGKKKEIAKDISAMANSAGGIIIYGIKEFDEEEMKHLPEKITPVNRSEYSKEWLEQIVNSWIQPKLKDLIIEAIQVSDENNQVVYVVKVPQSHTAHQVARDHRYYKRHNFLSESMEDYEIRDIMNRNINPEIILEFEIVKEISYVSDMLDRVLSHRYGEKKKVVIYELLVRAYNKGSVMASYVNYFLKIPVEILSERQRERFSSFDIEGVQYIECYRDNTVKDIVGTKGDSITGLIPIYGASRFEPILPERRSRSKDFGLVTEPLLDEKPIFWRVYTDNSIVNEGSVMLKDINITVKDTTSEEAN